jgi:hypothetical protein
MLSGIVVAAAVADHHGHRHFELAAGHIVGFGREVEYGVEAHADEIDKGDFHDRPHAGHGGAAGDADEAGFRDGSIDDSVRPEFLRHADRGAEHPAEFGDVLANHEDIWVPAHLRDDGLAAGPRHGERA